MKSGTIILVALLMGLSGHVQSDDTDIRAKLKEELARQEQEAEEEKKRFELYNGCLPTDLVVEVLSDNAKEIGLSRETIQNALESRLRAARLYQNQTPESLSETLKRANQIFPPGKGISNYLYARVTVVSPAYSIRLQYNKVVKDEMTGIKDHAVMWNKSITGTGAKPGFIMNNL
jgi:hypothetical protein